LEQNGFFGGDEYTIEAWKRQNNYVAELSLLQYKLKPNLWTNEWHNQVGMRGEEHLQRVYHKVLKCELK
ncbi:MAG: hypothetical protein AABY26_06660, partial [Nanoarchaeota archaeon]